MTFTAVVTSHNDPAGLRSILGQLRYQTRPPTETLAFCSDTNGFARLREHFPEAQFLEVENLDDWGHEKRALGIAQASGDWLGFFNDDDGYDKDYLRRMLIAGRGQDVVYCDWNESPDCEFTPGSSTAGNFIVRTRLAQQVGWQGRDYSADGSFIESLVRAGARVKKLPLALYTHNIRERG